MEWNSAVVAEHLSSNIFANWCSSVKLQKHICFKQVLGALNIVLGDHGAEFHPFSLNVEEHVLALHWVADIINSPQAGIFVACVE